MKLSVSGIMLVNGRHEMVSRAVLCFVNQTYGPKQLIVWDTGAVKWAPPFVYDPLGVKVYHRRDEGKTIGELRNDAISQSEGDVIATFDTDDWSHCRRLEEQSVLLGSADLDAVGYHQMLFWRTIPIDYSVGGAVASGAGEAWLYTHPRPNYVIGTSLFAHRHAWETKHFQALPLRSNPQSACEDFVWQSGMRCKAASAINASPDYVSSTKIGEPRMIACVHGSNTRLRIEDSADVWTRAAAWDATVSAILEAK